MEFAVVEKAKRPPVDWEAVEREYRAGIRSLRDIGGEFGCTETAIRKRAKRDEWERDVSAKVKAKADSLVRKMEVRKEVRSETAISEREQINVSAQMMADRVINQREDIRRARSMVQRLWELVDAELDHPDELKQLGAMLAAPDEFGNDKLNDMYFAAIGLPQQIKNAKLLADALKVLIELERKVLRIDEQKPVEVNPLAELLKAVSGSALPIAKHVDDGDDE
jgi:hypothetical protein